MKKKVVLAGAGIDRYFKMHGRRGDIVYRRKRNGEYEQYAYEYHPPGGRSPLKDRTSVLNRFANTISNPQYKDYSAILRKLYYYTPYFITPGQYALQGQTVFFVRQAGIYQLEWTGSSGISWQQKICRRTLVKICFSEPGEQELVLSAGEVEHCRRKFIILDSEADVEAAYTLWLEEHLAEVLAEPEPGYSRLRIYRRGLEPVTNIMLGLSGTYQGQIYYWHKASKISFLRNNYNHSENQQSQRFKEQKVSAISAWNAESEEFKKRWALEFWQWYGKNFRGLNRMLTAYMWYVSNYCRNHDILEE